MPETESFDDAEFWLPPQFLADEDDNKKDAFRSGRPSSLFPFDFGSFGVSSDLSSPVESVVGSSETESDEEDHMAGLTLQMARSTLDDGFKTYDSAFASENGKAWNLSGSPQSTLCALGSGCGCESRGSPNEAHSRVSSPPPPPPPSAATWDLLNAAAGEVAKMRLMSQNCNEEGYYKLFRGSTGGVSGGAGLLNVPRKPSLVNPSAELFLNHDVSQKQLQLQQLRQQQMLMMMKQQQSSAIWRNNTPAKLAGRYQQVFQQHHQNHQTSRARNQNGRTLGLSPSAWPPLQHQQTQQNGSGMRAVFLGNRSGKRECTGTGVFLPRQIGTQAETRRKPACSTVLVPARVVQALNLNLDDICGAQPQVQARFNGRVTPETDVSLRLRNSNNDNGVSHQKRSLSGSQRQVNQEIRLPQDWAY